MNVRLQNQKIIQQQKEFSENEFSEAKKVLVNQF